MIFHLSGHYFIIDTVYFVARFLSKVFTSNMYVDMK